MDSAAEGNEVTRTFILHTLSTIEKACLRFASTSSSNTTCFINGKEVAAQKSGDYYKADVTSFLTTEKNSVSFILADNEIVVSEIEILLKNGERLVWNTDGTWVSSEKSLPVHIIKDKNKPLKYADEEHIGIYEVYVPRPTGEEETRMYISYQGDVANLYQDGQLVADSYYDGTDWIVSVDRLKDAADVNPLIIRIDGLKSIDEPIYFEKNVDLKKCVVPSLNSIQVKQEYRFVITPSNLNLAKVK